MAGPAGRDSQVTLVSEDAGHGSRPEYVAALCLTARCRSGAPGRYSALRSSPGLRCRAALAVTRPSPLRRACERRCEPDLPAAGAARIPGPVAPRPCWASFDLRLQERRSLYVCHSSFVMLVGLNLCGGRGPVALSQTAARRSLPTLAGTAGKRCNRGTVCDSGKSTRA